MFKHLGVARCLAQAVLSWLLRCVLATGDRQRAPGIFWAVFSEHREQVRSQCSQHWEKGLSHLSPRRCLQNLARSSPWVVFVQRQLNPVVGFNLLSCATCEKQSLETGKESLVGQVQGFKQILLCLRVFICSLI